MNTFLPGTLTMGIYMQGRALKYKGIKCAQAFCCCFACNAWAEVSFSSMQGKRSTTKLRHKHYPGILVVAAAK